VGLTSCDPQGHGHCTVGLATDTRYNCPLDGVLVNCALLEGNSNIFAVQLGQFQIPIDRGGLFPTISFSYFTYDPPCPLGDCRTNPKWVERTDKIILTGDLACNSEMTRCKAAPPEIRGLHHDIVGDVLIMIGAAELMHSIDKLVQPDPLTPPGYDPSTWSVGPPSRAKAAARGETSYWDPDGGEWRWSQNPYHPPHWDYNPHDVPSSAWQNIDPDGQPSNF
jgi:hypothetical protein